MIALSHPTGNANVRAVLAALDEAGLLGTFYTTVGVRAGGRWQRLLPERYSRLARKREFAVRRGRIVFHPRTEVRRLLGWADIDEVYVELDRFVAGEVDRGKAALTGVYCYEDGALETFRTAALAGLRRFYDLPIAYWETSQRLLQEEAQRLPAWEPTLIGTRDPREKLERKTGEIELADVVLCPSTFVMESLPAHIRKSRPCVLAPFGSPRISVQPEIADQTGLGPLRVLFAGSLTQRKGLADLFQAMKQLGRRDVELVVMGSPVAPLEFYRREYPDFRYEAPRPHGQVLQLMQSCHVLALPSIVEGRALVQQEAMSCGLPLIVTPTAGGEDLIEEGRTGFLVPVRSPGKIAEKIAWLADHRDELPGMREAARRKAAEYTWAVYGARLMAALREALRGEAVSA